MIDYAVYDKDTGRVLRTGVTNQLHVQAISPNEKVLAGKGLPSTHYVLGNVLTERPANPAWISTDGIEANGTDEAAVGAIPNNSRVTVDGPVSGSFVVTDGQFLFTTEVPGVYEIEVFSFPERNKHFTVVAA